MPQCACVLRSNTAHSLARRCEVKDSSVSAGCPGTSGDGVDGACESSWVVVVYRGTARGCVIGLDEKVNQNTEQRHFLSEEIVSNVVENARFGSGKIKSKQQLAELSRYV